MMLQLLEWLPFIVVLMTGISRQQEGLKAKMEESGWQGLCAHQNNMQMVLWLGSKPRKEIETIQV